MLLTIRMLGNLSCFCCHLPTFFIINLFKKSFRNTIRLSNSLDPDQDRHSVRPGPKIIFFSSSTQLSTEFIMLINTKMPTIVGILTFISMLNTTSKKLKKQETSLFVSILVFMSSWNFMLSWVWKTFITLGPDLGPNCLQRSSVQDKSLS